MWVIAPEFVDCESIDSREVVRTVNKKRFTRKAEENHTAGYTGRMNKNSFEEDIEVDLIDGEELIDKLIEGTIFYDQKKTKADV